MSIYTCSLSLYFVLVISSPNASSPQGPPIPATPPGHHRTSSAPPAPQPPPMSLAAPPPPAPPAPPCPPLPWNTSPLPVASGPPPPPPPPVPNMSRSSSSDGPDLGSLAAQLQSARLRRSNKVSFNLMNLNRCHNSSPLH